MLVLGDSHSARAERYLDEGLKCNEDLVEKLMKPLSWIIVFMTFGRIPLMIISYWKLDICRYYIYY